MTNHNMYDTNQLYEYSNNCINVREGRNKSAFFRKGVEDISSSILIQN